MDKNSLILMYQYRISKGNLDMNLVISYSTTYLTKQLELKFKLALVPKAKEKKIARWYDYMMGGVIFENDCSYQQHYNEDHSKQVQKSLFFTPLKSTLTYYCRVSRESNIGKSENIPKNNELHYERRQVNAMKTSLSLAPPC